MGRDRGAAWADRRQQEKDAGLELLEDGGFTADVYRKGYGSSGHNTGFTSEVEDGTHIKSIKVRIDRSQSGDEVIGMTDDFDVKAGDLWRVRDLDGNELWWLVDSRVATESGSDVILKETRKGGWSDAR